MERNAVSIPELKWQYIGFEQNYVINYPATRINWPNYDPRLRYIYVHTCQLSLHNRWHGL